MSSNLGATLGHCILLHAKEYYKCFRKGGMKGNSYAFIGKERLAIGCCAAVIPVQIFAADLMVYHLMKQMPDIGNEASNFSATSCVYSYSIHQEKLSLCMPMSFSKFMVLIYMKANQMDCLTFLCIQRYFLYAFARYKFLEKFSSLVPDQLRNARKNKAGETSGQHICLTHMKGRYRKACPPDQSLPCSLLIKVWKVSEKKIFQVIGQ